MINAGQRPTRAEIDLRNLVYNFKSIRAFTGADSKFLAVVKADAYGHGAVECSQALEREGADFLGVAIPEEALELRTAGITLPILCLGGFWRGQEQSLIDYQITPVVFDRESASELDRTARSSGVTADIHVKIDTGMGRLGVPFADTAEFARFLSGCRNLRVEGLMTHFAAADDPREHDFTTEQIARFGEALAIFRNAGHVCSIHDLANSPGAICFPESRASMIRIGGILYGLGDDVLPAGIAKPDLRPVMTVSSEISLLKTVAPGTTLGYGRSYLTRRESLIASVPIGYNDGVPRALSNIGEVVVRGHRAPIVGRVSMDWILVDVTDIPDVGMRDRVSFIGPDDPNGITAAEIAQKVGTISYEITCGISHRVPRLFFDAEDGVMN